MFCKMMSFYSARYATRGRQKQLDGELGLQTTHQQCTRDFLPLHGTIIIWHKAIKLTFLP